MHKEARAEEEELLIFGLSKIGEQLGIYRALAMIMSL
ncbi:unnamed protein product [Cuscuta europaea]|uniref:Uncharacterized protein n=1 Tax=Cuscuta europaea TaxID=41803 RepID=A0A9P0VMX1_CUSEU|nr:unnamed protein product [Cuscuta europaea]